MVSQSSPRSARIASPCSLNSGARPAAAGSSSNCTGAATSWNGDAVGGLAVLHVAVGDGLRVGRRLERVLHDRPLADEVGEPLAPLVERCARRTTSRRGSRSASALLAMSDCVVGEALVGGELGPADDRAQRRPVLAGLQAGEREEAAVLGVVVARRAGWRPSRSGGGRPRDVDQQRQRHRLAHRPEPDAEQRHVDDRSPRRCARGGTARP